MKISLPCGIGLGLFASLVLFGGGVAGAEPLKVFYGLLHAHTFFSDGQGTPEEAFQAAKGAGLDFFAVTPHNHNEAESDDDDREDNILIANNHALYNSPTLVTITRNFKQNGQPRMETLQVKSVKRAAADATGASFVALYGQEFSTISSGNHVNVFEFGEVIEVGKGRFKDFYTLLRNEATPPVVQLNHPDVQKDLFYQGTKQEIIKQMFNDYGIDDDDFGPSFANLVAQTDGFVALIEMLSGPALQPAADPNFRYVPNHTDYLFYLTQGYHVSPSAGQDNHFKTWGTITDARTGVFAKSLTKTDLLEAMRANRTFATEDKNLEVSLTVNGTTFMGDNLDVPADTDLAFEVTVSDKDEPNATYEVQLLGGTVHPQTRTAATDVKPTDADFDKLLRTGNGKLAFQSVLSTGAPQFIYAVVVQNGVDRAWTAPIWINHPKNVGTVAPAAASPVFFWSSNTSSKVFHRAGCTSVRLIKPENLLSGTVPPQDRHQHTCTIPPPPPDH